MKTLMRTAALLAAACTAFACVASAAEMAHHHSFHGAQEWARVFDDPERDAWQKPHEVIQALGLESSDIVADIGAGTGYFSVRLAHMLPQGKVYAVDAEPDMVKYLRQRAEKSGLSNMRAVQATPDDARLPEKADLVLLVDVYHHIDDRVRYFRKLRGSLEPGGRIAIVDFRADAPTGPPKSMRLAPESVKRELREAGYGLAAEHGFLPYQYYLVFRKEAQ